MNDNELGLALGQLVADRKRIAPSPALSERVWAIPETTTRERRWLPRISTWRFQPMFSATKYVVAGVIVALFGGLLLSGVLTQQGEETAPLVGASASAQAETTDMTTEAPEQTAETEAAPQAETTTTTPDLLPGVDLVTEEIEPGVFRIVSDGAGHDFDHIASVARTPDGQIWLSAYQGRKQRKSRVFRLGQPGRFKPADGIPPQGATVAVGLDGKLFVHGLNHIDVVFDGQAWAAAPRRFEQTRRGRDFIAADGARWRIETLPRPGIRRTTADGDTRYGLADMGFDWGDDWPRAGGRFAFRPDAIAASPDGRVWVRWGVREGRAQGQALTEFDGEEWREIRPETWPQHQQGPVIEPGQQQHNARMLRVGPGGDLWVLSEVFDEQTITRVVLVWDGEEWTTLTSIEHDYGTRQCECLKFLRPSGLPGRVFDFDDAADGSIWAVVGTNKGPKGLYVITPEAVAATE